MAHRDDGLWRLSVHAGLEVFDVRPEDVVFRILVGLFDIIRRAVRGQRVTVDRVPGPKVEARTALARVVCLDFAQPEYGGIDIGHIKRQCPR
ncbi:hypothetical protein [Novosphingobium sp.]|uniref:hypothetical protein n=1 Tax=Novosphingobium sp. TaxID=1874826 RepID=UPI003D0CB059